MSQWALVALAVSTAQVNQLWWDGQQIWAATGGGLEAWSASGEPLGTASQRLPRVNSLSVGRYEGRLAVGTDGSGVVLFDEDQQEWVPWLGLQGGDDGRIVAVLDDRIVTSAGMILPDGIRLPGTVRDAVRWKGGLVAGTLEGYLLIWRAGQLERLDLGAPVYDLALVDGTVRVAMGVEAAIYDGHLTRLDLPATAAGPVWGTGTGEILDDQGVLARLPSGVTSLAVLPDGDLVVGTDDGLYLLGAQGTRRLTPRGQICGSFLTGVTMWQGNPAVSTFSDGACLMTDDGTWTSIPGLPTTMVNDILSYDDRLWLATSAGLASFDGTRTQVYPVVGGRRSSRIPGTHHAGVNGLAAGDRLWAVDVLGPVSIDAEGRWTRHRFSVWGTSYQDVAACGSQAWVASEDSGASRTLDGRKWTHYDAATGLPDDWVMAVACQGGQRAWAGTYQDGVWEWDGSRWSLLPGLPDPSVLSLLWDGRILWAGTMGGLYRWEDLAWVPQPGLPHPAVHDIWREGDILLAATEAGLAIFEKQ